MGVHNDFQSTAAHMPSGLKRVMPMWLRRMLSQLYWRWYETRDFIAEAIGWLPFHTLRLFLYQYVCQVHIGRRTSIHRGCRLYRPSGVHIGDHTIINREVLLDGRMDLSIGQNVSISEGAYIFSLEHDPNISISAIEAHQSRSVIGFSSAHGRSCCPALQSARAPW